MNRKLKISQIFGQFYAIFVICFIIFMYYDVLQVFEPDFYDWDSKLYANLYYIGFNILFIMLCWCLIRTMVSDPGKIPLFWGFYLNDPEHKKRRYCLICHVFKPERCHHCSICERCVLTMDHHCPWLNNCIGFSNRKYFFLLILYANIMTWYILGGFFPLILNMTENWNDFKYQWLWTLIPFGIFIPFSVIIFKFFYFHFTLIDGNMTTLESLDRQRQNLSLDEPSQYDIGTQKNWEQIFGKNIFLWPFPVFGESGKPVGDGVVFKVKGEESLDKTASSPPISYQQNQDVFTPQDESIQRNFLPPQYQNLQMSQRKQQTNLNHGQFSTSSTNLLNSFTNQSVLFGAQQNKPMTNSSFPITNQGIYSSGTKQDQSFPPMKVGSFNGFQIQPLNYSLQQQSFQDGKNRRNQNQSNLVNIVSFQ